MEEAAASLGATRAQVFRRVILPTILPAVLTGFTLAFARALGEYGSVVFIAGNLPMRTEITTLLIMTKLEQYDYAGATATCFHDAGALIRAAGRDQQPSRVESQARRLNPHHAPTDRTPRIDE